MGNGKKLKTEHAGAKNGGGYWGPRYFAKEVSRKKRRATDKKLSAESQRMLEHGTEDVKAGRVRSLTQEETDLAWALNTPIGYEACWKDLEGGGHCRLPKDHEGGCIGC